MANDPHILATGITDEAGFPQGLARLFVPARLECEELLDAGVGSPEDVKQNLDEMWRINCYLGGIYPLTCHLYPRLLQQSKTVTLVDLATGSAQLPLQIMQWAFRHQHSVRCVGLDLSARNLGTAHPSISAIPGIRLPLLQSNALQLPFKDQSVDYFISSLFLHHLNPAQLIELLRHVFAKVRKAVIFSDLERGWLPFYAFKTLQPVFARSYLTRHDGSVSILRAYTPEELLMLAQQAGLHHARIYRHFPWRMTLVAEKPESHV